MTTIAQELFDRKAAAIRSDLAKNQDCFVAQIVAKNPEINLLSYRLCCSEQYSGDKFHRSWWLEPIGEKK